MLPRHYYWRLRYRPLAPWQRYRKLLLRLAIPGMIGGAIGAYALSESSRRRLEAFHQRLPPSARHFIVWKALAARPIEGPTPRQCWVYLAAFSTLLAVEDGADRDLHTSRPRHDAALCHWLCQYRPVSVTLTISTILFTVGLSLWPIIAGLIIGGAIATPFAALATEHIPDKVLMLLVGCVVVLLSLRTILMTVASGP